MDMSVNNTVSDALAIKDATTAQEAQFLLLKKVLNSQADTIGSLIQSVPNLAVDSHLGGKINTYA